MNSAGLLVVGPDAADFGRSQEDVFRLYRWKKGVGWLVEQIELLAGRSREIREAFGFEVPPDRAANEATMSGDVYASVFVHG
jgi:hypothetical protein